MLGSGSEGKNVVPNVDASGRNVNFCTLSKVVLERF